MTLTPTNTTILRILFPRPSAAVERVVLLFVPMDGKDCTSSTMTMSLGPHPQEGMALYEMRWLLSETGVPLFFHRLAFLPTVPPTTSVLCARSVTWMHAILNSNELQQKYGGILPPIDDLFTMKMPILWTLKPACRTLRVQEPLPGHYPSSCRQCFCNPLALLLCTDKFFPPDSSSFKIFIR